MKEEVETSKEMIKQEVAAEVKKAEKSKGGAGSNNVLAVSIACVALVLAGVSAAFSYLSYDKVSTPVTFLNSG